ncbi:single-stranded DNA-binding protein [Clostridium estertheticum]|uniref:single-stranded DNA-binding protein n=1 Tax=Clostridium estertheticum TaxID=238834 RepID=UPI001C0CAEEF|nr:single-stranded DNA-binding protein [Clostridium estertheticum]MBU3174583.1 single-stranded DNA-binding protein [Clostridium estertheticum]MCB2357114.1 single-stranded DNA-binding protein [Clostridium estertheticum]WAG44036.1 single-stranded DNA-binding protein [Clostridium estertheticum]
MNSLLNIAISELDNIKSGEVFLLKDLYMGYKWNRLGQVERTNIGILFISEVRDNPSLNLTILPKTASNHQKYKKNNIVHKKIR